MPTDKPRITITMPEDQLDKVQTFQHENKLKNQTQAILKLIELGFEELQRQSLNENDNKKRAPKSEQSNSGDLRKEQVQILADTLSKMGMLNESNDLDDNDLTFLKSIFLSVEAYFQKGNKSIE